MCLQLSGSFYVIKYDWKNVKYRHLYSINNYKYGKILFIYLKLRISKKKDTMVFISSVKCA